MTKPSKALLEQRLKEREERQAAAGIPDSKIFADPNATESRILDCHVNGILVRDLPEEMRHSVPYYITDESIAERNVGRDAISSVTVDPLDKLLQKRRDEMKGGMSGNDAENPMVSTAKRYTRPGFKPKFLSTKNGTVNPDYVIVPKPNGDPVRYKSMVLGLIPEEEANARTKRYQDRSKKKLEQLSRKHKDEGGIVVSDAA